MNALDTFLSGPSARKTPRIRAELPVKDIDLVAALQNEGFELRSTGKSWAGSVCPSCGPGCATSSRLSVFAGADGRQRWKCLACNARGDFADFLAYSRKVPLRDALSLARAMYEVGGVELKTPQKSIVMKEAKKAVEEAKPVNTALQKVWKALLYHGHTSVEEVLPYFNSRGISRQALGKVVAQGMMRFLPTDSYGAYRLLTETVGRLNLQEADMWKEDAKWPAAAFRPVVSFLPGEDSIELRLAKDPTGNEPKAVRYGSARYPWFYRENRSREAQRILVIEGIIDVISVLDLDMVGYNDAIMGIPGVNAWKPEWFAMARARHPNAEFVIGVDDDQAGNTVAGKMLAEADSIGARSSRITPGCGFSDWNKLLQSLPPRRTARLYG